MAKVPEEDIELIPVIEWHELERENPWAPHIISAPEYCRRDSDCTVWSDDFICKTLYDKDRLTGKVKRKNECVRDKRYAERLEAARQEAPTGGRCTDGWRLFNCFNSGSGREQGQLKVRKNKHHKKKSKRKISQKKKTKINKKKGKQTKRKKRR